jgi:putative ABC transport system ATP-binding protein
MSALPTQALSDRSPVLEVIDVVKRYPGDPPVEVLHGIDLTIRRGELVGIVGPSGSGKSTLLNIIGTLDRPTSGAVRVAGHHVSALSDRQLSALRARCIGFVFQQFFLLDGMDALENVATGLLYTGMAARERRRRAAWALERVGLGHRLHHHPNQLSGGERQRVAIARAVGHRPEIVLADEPTGNLDSAAGAEVTSLLAELNAEGTTVAVITHNHELADSLPRQVEIRDGRIHRDSALVTTGGTP